MSKNMNSKSKAIEFCIANENSKMSIEDVDAFIKNIEGVKSVSVNSGSGDTKITLTDDSVFEQKFTEIQKALLNIGYKVIMKDTNSVQALLFFGTMGIGFLIVAIVMALFYYMGGSLPSLV